MSRIINKRCDICDKVVKYGQYWSKHCKTKKHLKNLEVTQKLHNNNQITTNNNQQQQVVYYGYCKYCDKGFKHQQSLSKHQKDRCKSRPLQETTQTFNNINNNTTNNNTTNNNTNNNTTNNNNSNNTLNQTTNNQITLNVYGEETIPNNFLTNELLEKLKLCNGDLTKTYLLLNDELYLKNKNNDNIKYTNIQSEYCQILSKDNDWKLKRLLEVMNERGIVVKQELEKELERIISEEGIKNNHIIIDPKMKQLQIMYLPMSKFEDNIEKIDDEDDDIKELYKRYQLELYNLRIRKNK